MRYASEGILLTERICDTDRSSQLSLPVVVRKDLKMLCHTLEHLLSMSDGSFSFLEK